VLQIAKLLVQLVLMIILHYAIHVKLVIFSAFQLLTIVNHTSTVLKISVVQFVLEDMLGMQLNNVLNVAQIVLHVVLQQSIIVLVVLQDIF